MARRVVMRIAAVASIVFLIPVVESEDLPREYENRQSQRAELRANAGPSGSGGGTRFSGEVSGFTSTAADGGHQRLVTAEADSGLTSGVLFLDSGEIDEVDGLIPEAWRYHGWFSDFPEAPPGAVITNFEYSFRIEDNGTGRFLCSDYVILIENQVVWNRLGSETDDGFDDDPWNDADIEIDWRTSSAFNDTTPNRTWDFWVFDSEGITFPPGHETEGLLNYVRFNIYWEVPPPSFSITDVSVTEGHFGTKLAGFLVKLRSPVDVPASVDWSTHNGTADSSDFAPSSGTVAFAPGERSKKISVVIYGDTEIEPDEIFYVDLANPANAPIVDGRGQGTILDDDSSVVIYDQSDYRSGEAAPTQDFEEAKDAEDCEAADDFVVSEDGWRIDTVELTNIYQGGSGPAERMNIWFYYDDSNWPDSSVACSYSEIVPTSDSAGNGTFGTIIVDLPSPCLLGPGRYWLAAQARMDSTDRGEFYWSLREYPRGPWGVWRQPGDGWGWGYTSWTRLTNISTEAGLNFRLIGATGVSTVFEDDFESGDCARWSTEVP